MYVCVYIYIYKLRKIRIAAIPLYTIRYSIFGVGRYSPLSKIDNTGREYVNQPLTIFLMEHGVIHELTRVDSPQQNGVAKKKKETSLAQNGMLITLSLHSYYLLTAP